MAGLIPIGLYKAKMENPDIEVSSEKGTACFKVTVVILEDGPHKNARVPVDLWLTDGAAKRSIQSMVYGGCTFPPEAGSTEPNLEDFTGCGSTEIEVEIEHEDYTPAPTDEQKAKNETPKTQVHHRVKWINSLGYSRTTKKVDKAQKRMISKTWAGAAKAAMEGIKSGGAGSGDTSFDTKAIEASGPAAGGKKLY